MAPPLVRGRALARRRIGGLVFIAVILLLVQTAIWLYQKKFTPVITVALQTNTIGNQLSTHADVKIRGLVIGEVRKVQTTGDGATLTLAIDPNKAKLVPSDTLAELLPKTLFGEKEVVLVPPPHSTARPLRNGDVIAQDRSTTAIETQTALTETLPLLKALQPEKLSQVLLALSSSVRNRGNKVGSNASLAAAYFTKLNPRLATAGADLQGLADLSENIEKASPDLVKELDNFAFSSRSVVSQKAALDQFLVTTSQLASTTQSFVQQNEKRFDALANDAVQISQLYASRSSAFPCMLNRIAFQEIEGERVFGGGQPGLHITIEATHDHGGYAPGDEPQYKEKRFFACFGLGKKPIIPFPAYANAQDGYRDSAPAEDPGKGPNGCCQAGPSGPTAGPASEPASEAAWYSSVASPSYTVVRSMPMPQGTTMLDALMLAPLTG